MKTLQKCFTSDEFESGESHLQYEDDKHFDESVYIERVKKTASTSFCHEDLKMNYYIFIATTTAATTAAESRKVMGDEY